MISSSSYRKLFLAIRTYNLSSMNILGKQLKVFKSIIIFNAILMVNELITFERPVKMYRHYQTMFMNISRKFRVWVFWFPDKNISELIFDSSTFPSGATMSPMGFDCIKPSLD